jgi:hydroxylamine reductase (hybrid-cluster protein)
LARSQNLANENVSKATAWVMYFMYWKEDSIMSQIAYGPVLEAMKQLKVMSNDKEARRLADVRERALMAERTEIDAAEARGEKRGEARGEARGIQLANENAIKRLIERGMSEAEARDLLRLQ